MSVQERIDDANVQHVRDAGYSEGKIVEIVATVAINIFTNYFNHIAQPEIDFPAVELAIAPLHDNRP